MKIDRMKLLGLLAFLLLVSVCGFSQTHSFCPTDGVCTWTGAQSDSTLHTFNAGITGTGNTGALLPGTGILNTPSAWTAAQTDSALHTFNAGANGTFYCFVLTGSCDMRIVPTGFSGSIAVQSNLANSASRLYLMPKGSATGTTAALKIFSSDYIADSNNYNDLGLYYDTVTAEYRINSKNTAAGVPTEAVPPVYFTYKDAPDVAHVLGGFFVNGTTPFWTFGGRAPVAGSNGIPAGFVYFSTVPIIYQKSAAFLDNLLLRWYSSDGTSAGNGIRFNNSIFQVLVNSSVVFSDSGTVFSKTGIINATSGYELGSNIIFVSATAPTISSGFGTSPSVTGNNGTAAFEINVGTGGTASSGVIGLPLATTGWNCTCTDITTQSSTVFACKQTASSTTSATITNYNTSAVASAWVASDKVRASCMAY